MTCAICGHRRRDHDGRCLVNGCACAGFGYPATNPGGKRTQEQAREALRRGRLL